jgi:hypothetical protein
MMNRSPEGRDGTPVASRRRIVGALAIGGLGGAGIAGIARLPHPLGGAGSAAAAVAQAQGATPEPSADDAVGRATAPAWSVSVATFQDPYPGQIQAPENPPEGVRFIATEVVIDNASDQAMAFTPADIRLVDSTGVEYRGGAAAGTEPFLGVRNLNGGDRSRGWVWFMVPESVVIAEFIYVAPTPLFRIPLG